MTNSRKHDGLSWLGAMALGLVMTGCGANTVDGSAVTGVAQSEAPLNGTVSLSDSSGTPQQRQVTTRSDGTFSVDVAGLTPPYMLRVAWTEGVEARRLYAVTEGDENLDVNPITDVAFSGASLDRDEDDLFEHSGAEEKRDSVTRARSLLMSLHDVLAPLFERYGITSIWANKAAVRALLQDVSVQKSSGVVTVTNKATGALIFSGLLNDLGAGEFHPENMPAGPGTTPTACTAFTFSAYGACQPGNTQTRSVLTSSPAGCTGGSPMTSQACTYTPPVTTCSAFTYSAYGACQPGNTQTRSVLTSSPSGCAGGAPITSQACTYTPPLDGGALYTNNCSSCHGTSKKGSSVSSIQSAIASNRGGMGSAALLALTLAELQAISVAP